MTDILGMIMNPSPRCMAPRCEAPATIDDDPFFFCDPHHDALVASLQQSGFPVASALRENATADVSPASSAVATISVSETPDRRVSQTAVASVSPCAEAAAVDLEIPEYLKRSSDNVPAFARLSGGDASIPTP